MIEVTGDIWTYEEDYKGITTNGDVNRHGMAVMGRGVAWQATQKFPHIKSRLGELLKEHGNHLFVITMFGQKLFTFPVKRHWREQASLQLITDSTQELADLIAIGNHDKIFVLPRPGCGNGGLQWEQVKPIIECLPDNVHVITQG